MPCPSPALIMINYLYESILFNLSDTFGSSNFCDHLKNMALPLLL